MGSQDSLAQAQQFVTDNELEEFPMVWDPNFDSWTAFGVRGQPTVVLLNPDGHAVKGWLGGIPEEEVLELAGEMTS